MTAKGTSRIRKFVTITLAVLGALLISLAVIADYVRLDLTPGFGIVQMFAAASGLTFLTTAAFLHVHSLRPKNAPRSLQADIGIRLGATGLIFTYVTGMSDLIGIGTHVDPLFERPFIGPFQLGGILIGVMMIIAGLILYYTSRGPRESSSLEFLFNVSKKEDQD